MAAPASPALHGEGRNQAVLVGGARSQLQVPVDVPVAPHVHVRLGKLGRDDPPARLNTHLHSPAGEHPRAILLPHCKGRVQVKGRGQRSR